MEAAQRKLNAKTAGYMNQMLEGEGPDFLGKEMESHAGTIDLLLYYHDNHSVHMVGIAAEEAIGEKRKTSREWTDLLVKESFQNVQREITGPSYDSRDFPPVELGKGYFWNEDLGRKEREEVEAALTAVFVPEPFQENYDQLDRKNLNQYNPSNQYEGDGSGTAFFL